MARVSAGALGMFSMRPPDSVIADARNTERHYDREKPHRTALPPRRSDEIRSTRHYTHPPRVPSSELNLGYLASGGHHDQESVCGPCASITWVWSLLDLGRTN